MAAVGLPGNNDMEKLQALSALSYPAQAKWFLNGFWEEIFSANNCAEAENVREYAITMIEIDEKNGENGCELDEMLAHRFLEKFGETLTVRELREALRDIDIDTNKKMSLSEYMIFRFKVDWHALVHKAQGDNAEEIAEAQAKLQDAIQKLNFSHQAAAEARRALAEATRVERESVARAYEAATSREEADQLAAEATAKADIARAAEADQLKAEEELRQALAELQHQEDTYNNQVATLTAKAETGGVVTRGRAKNELEQLKQEDPLPLRRAKINQGAVIRRQEKVTAIAVEARAEVEKAESIANESAAVAQNAQRVADEAAEAAIAAKAASDEAAAAAEQALQEANEAVADAEAFLQDAKEKSTDTHGTFWWMERELEEARKYKPMSKGGKAK
uniref:Protein tolA n=1 Tax=Hirondellea gigas TaxID=1518452 RepID=A0A6A7FWF9_9CRUS